MVGRAGRAGGHGGGCCAVGGLMIRREDFAGVGAGGSGSGVEVVMVGPLVVELGWGLLWWETEVGVWGRGRGRGAEWWGFVSFWLMIVGLRASRRCGNSYRSLERST